MNRKGVGSQNYKKDENSLLSGSIILFNFNS